METSLAIISDTIWFTPALFVLAAMLALILELVHRKERVPAGAPSSRPPGESLRLNLDNLNEKLIIRFLITVGVAVIAGMIARTVASGRNLEMVYGIMFTGSGIALALTLWTWRVFARWRHSHLGFEGERMVGRELNLLMLDGCRVFHDLVDPRIGNVDHIIVAAHAVFVVETCTWSNHAPGVPGADPRVVFNGRELQFPDGKTDKPIKQVLRNAKWLEKYVMHKTGLQLPVFPILTLPGWTVERKGAGPVTVVNPKDIPSVVVDRVAAPIYDAQRQRIINLLDEKCQYRPF